MFKAGTKNPAIESGVWAEYDGCEFLIAHTSNLAFQRALSRLQQPHRKKIQDGTLDPEVNRKIICQAMAEGILLDWRSKPGAMYTLPPYTKELGAEELVNQPEFRDFVSEYSMSLLNFRQEEVAETGES